MTTLANLVAQLEALAPAAGDTPTAAQYEQAVRNAVADFGRRVPRRLVASIPVTAGTAAYDLPAGFQKLIKLERIIPNSHRRNADGLLVAFGTTFEEQITVDGDRISFYPTPGYTLERDMIYAAGYPYDADADTFTGLTDHYAQTALIKAQALIMQTLGAAAAGAGTTYRLGDLQVDKSKTTQNYAATAAALEGQYAQAVSQINGPTVHRSFYEVVPQ